MRPRRHTATNRAADDRSGEGECTPLDRFAHPFGESDCGVRRRPGKHQHELLPAIPADTIDLPGLLAQQLRELAQDGVTRLVTVRIVDALEAIQIAHHAGKWLLETARMLECLIEPLFQTPAVVDSRQPVRAGDPNQLIIDRRQIGLLPLNLLLERLDAQQRPHARFQLGKVDWLRDVVVRAGVEADDHVFGRVERCLDDDRNERQLRIRLDATRDLEAIQSREHDVEQNEVRQWRARGQWVVEHTDRSQRLLTVVSFERRIPARPQPIAEDDDVVGVIVDDQDARVPPCRSFMHRRSAAPS